MRPVTLMSTEALLWNNINFLVRDLELAFRPPKLLIRPRWVPKKAIAERHSEREKTTAVEFALGLAKAPREDVLRCWEESKGVPRPLVYAIVRASDPSIVVETGVREGKSPFSILQSLADNGEGLLYCIELGGASVINTYGVTYNAPPDEETGSLVSAELWNRWHLILGDAKKELPPLLSAVGAIDIFLHDSLHTEEHMLFQFETGWPFLRKGAVCCPMISAFPSGNLP